MGDRGPADTPGNRPKGMRRPLEPAPSGSSSSFPSFPTIPSHPPVFVSSGAPKVPTVVDYSVLVLFLLQVVLTLLRVLWIARGLWGPKTVPSSYDDVG